VTASYLFALGVVLALAVGSVALMRFAQGRGLAFARISPIRVVAQHSVGMGASLVLVEIDGARMLVGVSKAGLAFPTTSTRGDEPVSAPTAQFAPVVRPEKWTLKQVHGDDCLGDGGSFSAVLKRAGAR
jgi:flagellar biogenesis protein FliO